MADMVNHPNHYTQGGIELIDVMEAKMGTREFEGYLQGAIIKYVFRYHHKGNPVQDLKKAEWYLRRLIEYRQNIEKEDF